MTVVSQRGKEKTRGRQLFQPSSSIIDRRRASARGKKKELKNENWDYRESCLTDLMISEWRDALSTEKRRAANREGSQKEKE